MTDTIRIGLRVDPGNVEPASAQAAQALGRIGTAGQVSAKQAAAALRGLPAQFTDIAVSLQGGQNPLTVLLQQGGQIKDQFGGIGPAVRAVAGQVASLITPVTAVAAAGLAFAVAYQKGAAEASTFARQLILTGNAAGTTAGRLQDASKRVAAVAGTQAQAAAALAELAGAANINPAGLERFAAAAVRMERATGTSVADTVKQFAELGRAPVEASVKLNETTNYLTASVYQQIKALQDSGRTADAARLAQETWADATSSRGQQITERLGLLERAWKGIKESAGAAWDAMLNVGRADTLADQLATAEKQLADKQRDREKFLSSLGGGARETFARRFDAQAADLQATVDSLREQIRLEGRAADTARERVQQGKARIEFDRLAEQSLSEQERLSRAIAQANQLADAAGASAAERAQVIAALRDKFKPDANPFASQQEAAKDWAASLKDFARIADNASAKAAELTEGQKRLLQYLESPGYLQASEPMRQLALQEAYAAIGAEQNAAAHDKLQRTIQEARKAYVEKIDALKQGVAAIDEQVVRLRDEEAAAVLAASANITLAQALAKVEIARLRERQVAAMGNEDMVAIIQREIDARQRLADAMDTRDAREAADRLRRDQAAEWQRVWDQVGDGLADALINGGRRASDIIKQLFADMVLRPALAPVLSGLGGLFGMSSASAAPGASGASVLTGGSSPFAGLGSLFGGGGSLGALGSIFNSGSAMAMNGGTLTSLTGAGTMMGNGSMLAGLAQGAGTIAPWLGAISLGRTAGQSISNGFALGGGSGNTAVNIGTAIGSLWGPLGAGVGAALGGVVNRAFGRRPKETRDSGIVGSLGGEDGGATLQSFQDWRQKGGWFRSSRSGTNFGALDDQTSSAFSDGVAAIQAATRGYAATLGLSADSVDGYTQQIRLSLLGLNDQQIAEAIQSTLSSFADGLAAGLGADLRALAKPGETVGVTLARLATSLQQVNGVLDNLNQGLLATGTFGADAASKLLEAFGGIESYVTLSASFLDEFYSAGERSSIVTRQLTAAFSSLGLALPSTRDGFRALVEAQDLTNEEGRQTYASLLRLSSAFAGITDAAELQVDSLVDEIERLRGAGTRASAGLADLPALLAQFATASGQARAGSQSALDSLPGLSQSIEAASQATARSAAEAAAMRAYLVQSLTQTLGNTGAVTVETAAVATSTTGAPASATTQSGSVVQELQALRGSLEQLRTDQQMQAAQLATNTGKLYRLMDRVTQNGDAIGVRVLT
jgi:phage-related minor tail protein